MSICPKCGNQIQGWAHGVCYTCVRNKQDYKRFGRRRPARRRRPIAPPLPKPTYNKRCAICGKSVRSDRLNDHMWHAHNIRASATAAEIQRKRNAWDRKGTAKAKAKEKNSRRRNQTKADRQMTGKDWKRKGRTKIKSKQKSGRPYRYKKCPTCERYILLELIDSHMRSHQQAAKKPIKQPVRRKRPMIDRSRRKGSRAPKIRSRRTDLQPDQKTKSRQLVNGINQLLGDVYDETTRLSHILLSDGVSQSEITLFKGDQLELYLFDLLDKWITWWSKIMPPGCVAILTIKYDLIVESEQKSKISRSLRYLSSAEKEQLLATAMRNFRTSNGKLILREIVVSEAKSAMAKSLGG